MRYQWNSYQRALSQVNARWLAAGMPVASSKIGAAAAHSVMAAVTDPLAIEWPTKTRAQRLTANMPVKTRRRRSSWWWVGILGGHDVLGQNRLYLS